MPKTIALYLKPLKRPQTVWFRRPDGSLDSLPALRLVAAANLMHVLTPGPGVGQYAIVDCVIDTGAHFSIVAEDLWRRFIPGFVTPLPFDALTPPHLRFTSVAGGRFAYELGEFPIQLEDQNRAVLPVTVIAKLTCDGGKLPIPLTLGLRGGFFEGRTFLAATDPVAPYAQRWTLTEA